MNTKQSAPAREIVLAGGGHTHALVLRALSQHPVPDTRITLVSPAPISLYSGMLPGVIAGHFPADILNIDLRQLCRRAGAHFICASVTGLEPTKKQLSLSGRGQLGYDVLSLNTGSAPDMNMSGAAEHGIPVRPITRFLAQWQALLSSLKTNHSPAVVSVIGGGAGAVETILAMAWACRQQVGIQQMPGFRLVFAESSLLPGYSAKVRQAVISACRLLGVQLQAAFRVTRLTDAGLFNDRKAFLPSEHTFLCTQAAAPHWPAQAGLPCNAEGFVRVTDTLQAVGHSGIFAVGDIAHMDSAPCPKAGVYAVRQAPVLHTNLRRIFSGAALEMYEPQHTFLSLLALGNKQAVGSRGVISFSGAWAWHWKKHIDLKFLNAFKS